MKKLYVGNLPYSFNDDTLKQLFSAYNSVLSATIIIDRNSRRSKGFGFVELEDDAEADNAISAMNGTDVEGRAIVVSEARPMNKN
ncbi:RNA-binding protein [Patescibacteria group bacterium]|nr:RNA-binding protein [Patescibacteria group bacterium]